MNYEAMGGGSLAPGRVVSGGELRRGGPDPEFPGGGRSHGLGAVSDGVHLLM